MNVSYQILLLLQPFLGFQKDPINKLKSLKNLEFSDD